LKKCGKNLGVVSFVKLILEHHTGEDTSRALQASRKEYVTSANPLIMIIRELLQKEQLGYVHVRKGDFALTLQKHPEANGG
jgi:hypothetical protein